MYVAAYGKAMAFCVEHLGLNASQIMWSFPLIFWL